MLMMIEMMTLMLLMMMVLLVIVVVVAARGRFTSWLPLNDHLRSVAKTLALSSLSLSRRGGHCYMAFHTLSSLSYPFSVILIIGWYW